MLSYLDELKDAAKDQLETFGVPVTYHTDQGVAKSIKAIVTRLGLQEQDGTLRRAYEASVAVLNDADLGVEGVSPGDQLELEMTVGGGAVLARVAAPATGGEVWWVLRVVA